MFSTASRWLLYSLDKQANDQAVIDIIGNAQKYVYFAVYV
jgi:hypothetical protein